MDKFLRRKKIDLFQIITMLNVIKKIIFKKKSVGAIDTRIYMYM